MKERRLSPPIISQKSVLASCKAEFIFLCFFSLSVFFTRIFTIHKIKAKKATFLYRCYYFHVFHRKLDIGQVIAAESSPLCIAGS